MPAPDRDRGSPRLEAYLARLESSLATLPAAERRDILLETRSHVTERMQRDSTRRIDDILAELGSPPEFARGFLAERALEADDGTLEHLAALTGNGWRSIPLLCVVAGGYAIAAFLVLVALSKILEPGATGWFVRNAPGEPRVAFVVSDPRHPGRDVLGFALVPIALALALAIHWSISRLLRRFVGAPASANRRHPAR